MSAASEGMKKKSNLWKIYQIFMMEESNQKKIKVSNKTNLHDCHDLEQIWDETSEWSSSAEQTQMAPPTSWSKKRTSWEKSGKKRFI